MESFSLNTVSTKEKNLFIRLLESNDEIIAYFLEELGRNDINILSISISVLEKGEKSVVLILDDDDGGIVNSILEKFNYKSLDIDKILSSFVIKGTRIRGQEGYVEKILTAFSNNNINLELLISGALSYEFYILEEHYNEGLKTLLNALDLPNMVFE